jgi:hypothetical protein
MAFFVAAQPEEQWFARRSSNKASNSERGRGWRARRPEAIDGASEKGLKDFRQLRMEISIGPSQRGPANLSRIMIQRRTYVVA